MSEIINNIAITLNWDIFLMGFFTLLLLGAGLVWLGNSSTEFCSKTSQLIHPERKTSQQIQPESNLKKTRIFASIVVALVAIYYVGVMVNTFSDDWIDKRGISHLFLKSTWLKPSQHDIELGSDDAIKVDLFQSIYKGKQQNTDEIIDFYYYAKNKLWKDELWKKYILYSQTMINISRVWCFTFFLLLPIAFLRFLFRFVLWMRGMKKPVGQHNVKARETRLVHKPGFDVLLSVLVAAIALIGYQAGGIVWKNSEKEIDSKIFGVYRSEHAAPPLIVERIKVRELSYEITELAASQPLEASGVAAFDDHLFIVSDKNNALYAVNPEASSHSLSVIKVPEFSEKNAKFEDISFHRDSGFFYVIGAHYSTVPAYQKVYRFKMLWEGASCRPIQIDTLLLSQDILPYLPGRARVEGIAVAGSAKSPTLFIGIRSDKPGVFRILEFSWGRSEFELRTSYDLSLSPIYSRSGVAYHLSGLASISDSVLLVLATSEDTANGFHGNRLYTVDPRERKQTSVTPEFAAAQKAEGIAVWDESESRRRFAIVFDNDKEDTGQPSRLLIANSLHALRE
ncbi:MAG: hypothetical protein JSU77_07455 [Fidelibacterota bacterium]|nr:MAG: hypothetical protein JSU77_07455 [Candidatus Neomarinimicrobiota bacterium]